MNPNEHTVMVIEAKIVLKSMGGFNSQGELTIARNAIAASGAALQKKWPNSELVVERVEFAS